MFIHSVKVHRLYKTAAKIIKQVCEEGKGVKHLLFEQTRVNIKTLNALVFETLRHAEQIDLLLRKSSLLISEPRLCPWLARVLMTEMLWGQKDKLISDAKPIKTILSYEKKFQAILRDNAVEMPELIEQVYHPRYVRINTLTMTIQEAVDGFRDEGWTIIKPGDNWTYKDYLKAVRDLQPNTFMPDFHIPELFVFPPGTHFHEYQCYMQGHVVLQDKASCMAAHLLAPEPGSNVLDMCAAPGMKTTHLAAILGNRGTVYAVERDTRRHGILSEIVQATHATCVKTINEDVLKIRNEQCPDVEYILVDPSCSGSGMLDRIESASNVKNLYEQRLKSLSGFQILILRHALTAYPKAKRVIYSTCSVMPQENEEVVKEVLETTKQFRLVPVQDYLKKDWLSFGSEDYKDIGEKCLYAKSATDYTNGFFMAVFERVAPHDDNDLYIRGRKWKKDKEELENNKDSVENTGDIVVNGENRKNGENENCDLENVGDLGMNYDEKDLKRNKKIKKKANDDEFLENTNDVVVSDENDLKSKKKIKKEKIGQDGLEENAVDMKIDHKKRKRDKKNVKEDILTQHNCVNDEENETRDDDVEKLMKKSKKHKREKKNELNVKGDILIQDEDGVNKAENEENLIEGNYEGQSIKKSKKIKKRKHDEENKVSYDDEEEIKNNKEISNISGIDDKVKIDIPEESGELKVKKSKKDKISETDLKVEEIADVVDEENKVKKCKKSKKHKISEDENLMESELKVEEISEDVDENKVKKCKKSKKSKTKDIVAQEDLVDKHEDIVDEGLTKKSKKKKSKDLELEEVIDEEIVVKKKKKKD